MKALSILLPKNWSRYSRQFSEDSEAYYKYKRVILLSQFTLFGAVIGILHALEDLVDGLVFMPVMDAIMAVFIFVAYLLNENEFHKTARIFLLTFLNIYFFVYCSLVPKELGIYFYYFAWIGLASVIFEPTENLLRIFFVAASIGLILLLHLTDFSLFGDFNIQVVDVERSFLINLISSIIVLVFFIVFMARTNDLSEERLVMLAREVQEKNARLQKTNDELDRFVYSASHDLRAPLMSIKGLINLAQFESKDGVIQQYLAMMVDRTDKLDDFIHDIIDYARNARTGIVYEPVDLDGLVNDIFENHRFAESAQGICFEKKIALDKPVYTDKRRLSIVLNNLLSNAIKYHRKTSDALVKVAAQIEDTDLKIEVSDNGQGIPADRLGKIFDMFYRGTEQSKGSGLGLYIVKETVEKMGGVIRVTSEFERGSSFIIKLPLAIQNGSEQRHVQPVQAPTELTRNATVAEATTKT
ncbi:MAG: HAMP domain-containing histidine kinase [Flammeovirgaceae bacterium]|nr:MAG: HAMP domain-containing histidine kinase [Flammeovirgaceae bacterium]